MLIAGALLRAAAGDSGEDTSGQVHQAAAFCSISKAKTKKTDASNKPPAPRGTPQRLLNNDLLPLNLIEECAPLLSGI